jgi:hypothetical protein
MLSAPPHGVPRPSVLRPRARRCGRKASQVAQQRRVRQLGPGRGTKHNLIAANAHWDMATELVAPSRTTNCCP